MPSALFCVYLHWACLVSFKKNCGAVYVAQHIILHFCSNQEIQISFLGFF